MKMNNDWRDELKEKNYDCYLRLCECRNTVNDVILMARYVHKYNPTVDIRDCFNYMIEWCCDWNSQFKLFDKIDEHYDEYLQRI